MGLTAARGTNPFSRMAYGLSCYQRGVSWLFQHKKYLFLTFVPTIIGFIALSFGWGYFFVNLESFMTLLMFEQPESWWGIGLYWVVYGMVFVGVLACSLVACLLLVNVIASPIYDYISLAVEKDQLGETTEIDLWASLKLMGEELKKVLFIAAISIVSLVLTSFIPGLNLLALALTAFLLGWDFYDYPLARRGYSFKQRWQEVGQDAWSVGAFGIFLMIPFVQFILMPLAVCGGTLMALEGLAAREKPAEIHP